MRFTVPRELMKCLVAHKYLFRTVDQTGQGRDGLGLMRPSVAGMRPRSLQGRIHGVAQQPRPVSAPLLRVAQFGTGL
jgi:hypothetical protein